MILFSILVVIQFVVITQGATRISEVAARFMLDGLPGRQMAIDADLHAGLIDQHEAHRRREEVYRQADFFGAMDGAGKFVRGDAIAGVVIMLVNIGGGLFLGMVNYGMSPVDAINVFTKLTIGDGLVSQVPGVPDLAGRWADRDPVVVLDRPESRRGRPAVLTAGRAGYGRRVPGPHGIHPAARSCPFWRWAEDWARRVLVLGMRRDDEIGSTSRRRGEDAATGPGYGAIPTDRNRRPLRPSRRAPQSRKFEATTGPADPSSERMEDLLHVDPLELEIGFRLDRTGRPDAGAATCSPGSGRCGSGWRARWA